MTRRDTPYLLAGILIACAFCAALLALAIDARKYTMNACVGYVQGYNLKP